MERAKPWSRAVPARRDVAPDERWASEILERLLRGCHPYQAAPVRAVMERRVRFLTGLVARGGGKTTMLKVLFIAAMSSTTRGRYLFGAPTREMATDLLWEPMQETCSRLAIDVTFKEVQRVAIFNRTGSRLKLVGLDDKREMGKQRGQPFDGIGLDEICEFPPELIEWFVDRIVGPRLGERMGWLALTSTPGILLRGLFYDATRPGSQLHVPYEQLHEHPTWDSWVSFAWSRRTIAELPDARTLYPAIVANWEEALRIKARNQWGDDNPVWLREHEGRWASDGTRLVFRFRPHVDGKAWNIWEPARRGKLGIAVLPDTFSEWFFVIAMDEGLSDPFAINVFAISPHDASLTIYHVWGMERGRGRRKPGESEPTGEEDRMYARGVAQLLIGEALDMSRIDGLIGDLGEWPVGIEGDIGESLEVELLRVYGIKVVRFDRTAKYKDAAIEVVNGDLYDGRIKILKGSPLATQLGELEWSVDQYGNRKENKAQANHSTDTLIIARRMIGRLISAGTITAPDPKKPAAQRPPAGQPQPDVLDHEDRPRGEFAGMLVGGGYDPFGVL